MEARRGSEGVSASEDFHDPQNFAIDRALFLLVLLLLSAIFRRGGFESAWVIALRIIPAITHFSVLHALCDVGGSSFCCSIARVEKQRNSLLADGRGVRRCFASSFISDHQLFTGRIDASGGKGRESGIWFDLLAVLL